MYSRRTKRILGGWIGGWEIVGARILNIVTRVILVMILDCPLNGCVTGICGNRGA